MEMTIHHTITIELGRNAMIALLLILGVIAFCTLYPMLTSPVLSSEPLADPPKEPMGFRPSDK